MSDSVKELDEIFDDTYQKGFIDSSGLSYFQHGEGKHRLNALIEKKVRETELKKDIKYHTLKARWQRMYLGGNEDSQKTKRYVVSLKKQLAQLQANRTRDEK